MGPNDSGEAIFRLERFNISARKLKESRLMEWFPQNSLRIDFLVTKEAPRANFPPDSHFEEFLTLFHKCITDEQCSVGAIARIYQHLDGPAHLKDRFKDFHSGLYHCLDAKPFKDVKKLERPIRELTLLGLMDIFLYGEFHHDHPRKAEMVRKILDNKSIREFYWFEFYTLVYKSALILFHVMLLNESLLKVLKSG